MYKWTGKTRHLKLGFDNLSPRRVSSNGTTYKSKTDQEGTQRKNKLVILLEHPKHLNIFDDFNSTVYVLNDTIFGA